MWTDDDSGPELYSGIVFDVGESKINELFRDFGLDAWVFSDFEAKQKIDNINTALCTELGFLSTVVILVWLKVIGMW